VKVIPGFPVCWLWAYLVKVIMSVPSEGYCTWWRLLWAYLVKVIPGFPIFWLWANNFHQVQ
jgi:hypothetical protein